MLQMPTTCLLLGEGWRRHEERLQRMCSSKQPKALDKCLDRMSKNYPMLSDDLWEAREHLQSAYKHYCSGSNANMYDEDIKGRLRAIITEMIRIQKLPGMDLPPGTEPIEVREWFPEE